MKMYRETLRRLLPIGLPLALGTLIYTLITGGQNCFGLDTISVSTSALGMTPVLTYYVFTAVAFALYGFSYLFRRPASDLYHSLPVNRMDLYLSVTLATASWMGATILLNELLMLMMLLVGGCPFVPIFVPMNILFYFVASMIMYAATAIGCALSGTYLTALASTGVVLLLPRFIQFILARGVVAKVSIIGWLDLGFLLDPSTNIATGLIVMQSRNVFYNTIVSWGNILYSMVPMVVGLLVGGWLFVRRPSEASEHGASHQGWVLATACALALAALLLITIDSRELLTIYGAAITVIALLVFIIYQLIASRSLPKVLKSLPWFLLSAAVAFCISLSIDGMTNQALSVTPTPDEIESVTFRGHDQKAGWPEYTTLQLDDIQFTSPDIRRIVSESLDAAVEKITDPKDTDYDSYNQYQVIEPITLKLTNGSTVMRTIEFKNVDTLNEYRSENEDFKAAIRSFPDDQNVQYVMMDYNFSKEENRALWLQYVEESKELGLIPDVYYRSHKENTDNDGRTLTLNGDQTCSSFSVSGYEGTRLFSGYHSLFLETPKTFQMMMNTTNSHMKSDTLTRMAEGISHIVSPLTMENDSFSLDLVFFNLPYGEKDLVSRNVDIYLNGYSKQNDTDAETDLEYLQKFEDVLSRATLTDDPSGLFVRLNWYEYDSSNRQSSNEPTCFLKFSKEDEALITSLVEEYRTAIR